MSTYLGYIEMQRLLIPITHLKDATNIASITIAIRRRTSYVANNEQVPYLLLEYGQ